MPQLIPDYKITEFKGLLTEVKDLKSLPNGFTPDALNWLTSSEKDSIALRRGVMRLGKTQGGEGKITGLGVGIKANGQEVPFFTAGRKLFYYDADLDDRVEVGSNLFPASAENDEFSIFPYHNLAGHFIYISSLNSSVYKIPVANPANAVDQQMSNYRGFLKFGQSRSFLFDRNGTTAGNRDETGLYVSWIDKVSLADYPQVTGEVVGSAGNTHYEHTLIQITGKRTAMYVKVSANTSNGLEVFIDDRNGNLISDKGGTGTINYATGELVVDFVYPTTGSVTADYYYEDATNQGVLDFSFNVANRTPGTGNYFPQFDGGGSLNACYPLATTFYSFHDVKTWQTAIPTDDGASDVSLISNLPFREKMGVKSKYGAFGGEKGIYFVNTANPSKPELMVLTLFQGATQANIAAPQLLSQLIDFSEYDFERAVIFEWGDYVLIACGRLKNGVAEGFNSRVFLYNKKSGVFDLTDFPVTRLAEYYGMLLGGDALTNNVYVLFSGFDDDGEIIPNYWTSGMLNFGVSGQKKFTRMVFDGLIQTAQQLKVYLSFDGGDFIEIFTIEGDAKYVDKSKSISVGNYTIGSKVAGGGSGEVFANPFQVEFKVQSPKFEYTRLKIEAVSGGFVQINEIIFKDIRYKGRKVMPSRMA